MTEKLCKTCRHWEKDQPPWTDGTCEHPKMSSIDIPEGSDTCTANDGGSMRVINTGPDFGCIHWQEKAWRTLKS